MPRTLHIPALDRMAVGLSGLCVLHCLLSVVLVSLMSTAGTFLTDPSIHQAGLAGAVMLGALALGQGYLTHRAIRPALVGIAGLTLMATGLIVEHGWPEVAVTITGVVVLAAAHLLNASARRA